MSLHKDSHWSVLQLSLTSQAVAMVMTGVGEGEETAEQVGGRSWWLGTGTYMQAFPGVRERSPQISSGASESHHWLELLASILQCKTTSRLFIFHKP